ncbi:mannan endo-1,4-beta-mannosidase 5-like [Canna indica]|uniref:Mannan endo-1,4-beta-mannosidase 5-like n=1 Tax=Canna indica TaxID=4628 RepID=A0AAQ3JPL2_9LILI|nr:mannan endo-1,4-beta-mannosidase 5-like [Canna indica]
MTPLNLQSFPHSSLYKHSSKLHLSHSKQQHLVFFNKMAKLAYAICFILAALTLLSIFVPGCKSTSSFVGRRGTQFVLDGSPFLFNGFNAYWMIHVAVDPAQRGKVAVVLRQAAAATLIVGQTWAFNNGGDQAL